MIDTVKVLCGLKVDTSCLEKDWHVNIPSEIVAIIDKRKNSEVFGMEILSHILEKTIY